MATAIAEREQLRTVTVERRNPAGEVLGRVELDPEIFGRAPNVALMHQVVTAQRAARRSGTHSTRTRAEVAGGGSKPYRQKGLGRARQGTIRAPQFEGGGVAHGPKPRSYAQRTPRKMTRLALACALSDRAAEGRLCLVDAWTFDVPRTKDAIAALRALGLSGNVLVVLGTEDFSAERSFANLGEVDLVEAGQLTAYDVLVNDWVVFTDATLPGSVTTVATEPAKKAAPKKAAAAKKAAPAAEAAPKDAATESDEAAPEVRGADAPAEAGATDGPAAEEGTK